MIAYDELQKALARWKAKRTGSVSDPSGASLEAGAPHYHNPDHTGELDLADAEVSEARDDSPEHIPEETTR